MFAIKCQMGTQGDILKLSSNIQSSLRSNVNINGYSQCVLELIYNSLDSHATSVAVRVDLKNHKIQVIDNGCGILSDDLKVIGKRYMTSKCKSLDNLKHNLNQFGYRGEALASIICMSESVNITSLHYKDRKTYVKGFFKGIENDVKSVHMRPTHGTTVTITNFMYNLGVRQKRVDPIFDMEEIRTAIETVALVHFHISFSLRDDNDSRLVLKTHKSKSIREAFFFLLDERVGDTLQPFEISENKYKMDGYIARGTHSTKMLQYVYVNKRPVKNSDIQKALNFYFLKESFFFREQNNKFSKMNDNGGREDKQWFDFKSDIKIKKFPVYIINVSCPYTLYDTTLLPDKSSVQFNKWDDIQKLLHKVVKDFVKKELGCPLEMDIQDKREKNCPDKDEEKNLNGSENDLIKKALYKNAADFGPSQMRNAVKGAPARRKRKPNNEHEDARKEKHLKTEIDSTTAAFCTPKQNINTKKVFNKHAKHFSRNKKNKNTKSNSTLIHINERNDKMRETPLVWSQLADFKKPLVKPNAETTEKKCKAATNEILNEIGINSSLLLKKQCNKTIHRSIFKNSVTSVTQKTEYIKSHTNVSRSSIFHVKYKNGSLNNPFDKNKTVQQIEEWFNKNYVSGCKSKVGTKRTFQKSKHNYIFKDAHNNSEKKNDVGKSYLITQCKNLEEYTVQVPRKFKNVPNDASIQKDQFKCINDMIKTVIVEPKIPTPVTDKDINNYKHLMKVLPTDWNEYYDQCISVLKHKDDKFSMKQYAQKDSGVQTDLCFKDLELMMYDLRNKYKEIEKYESEERRDICKQTCSLRNVQISSLPNVNIKCVPICQSINGSANNPSYKKSLCEYTNNCDLSHSKVLPMADIGHEFNTKENLVKSLNKSDEIIKKTPEELCMSNFFDNAAFKLNSFNMNKNVSVDFRSGNNNFCDDLCIHHIAKDTQSQSNIYETNIKQKPLAPENITPILDLGDVEKHLKIIHDTDFNIVPNVVIRQNITQNNFKNNHIVNNTTEHTKCDKFENDYSNKSIQSKLQEKSSNINFDENFVTSSFKACLDKEFNDSLSNEIMCTTGSMSILETPISCPLKNECDDSCLKKSGNINLIICETITNNNSKSSSISEALGMETTSNKVIPVEKETTSNQVIPDDIKEADKINCATPIKVKNNWTVKTDSFGKLFYINNRTGMTVYENPSVQENPYRVYKRPEYMPKGMSPILKLGESFPFKGVNINTRARYLKENSSHDPLSKVKWAELYYTEKLYNEFASELTKNMDFQVAGILNNDIKHIGVKNTQELVFEKSLLNYVKVINQVDNKFIAIIVEDAERKSKFLTLFDQHAVHERIRLEYLLKEFQEGKKWKSISIQKPLTLDLQQSDLITLLNHKESFENFGLTFQISKTNQSKIEITSVPSCFQYKELNEDDSLLQLVDQLIAEEIDVFKVTRKNTSTIPAAMMRVISSKACHGAVKFGMKLTKEQCEELMRCLAKCDVPFQCAHGRPVLTILAEFNDLKYSKVHKLNMKNIKMMKKS